MLEFATVCSLSTSKSVSQCIRTDKITANGFLFVKVFTCGELTQTSGLAPTGFTSRAEPAQVSYLSPIKEACLVKHKTLPPSLLTYNLFLNESAPWVFMIFLICSF